MRYVFFSLNEFKNEGGGTIRMLGILNELSRQGHEVVFISNANNYEKFNKNIKHISVNYRFNQSDKRRFQLILGAFSLEVTNKIFSPLLKRLKVILGSFDKEIIYFFEYLDNSIGYWLKQNNFIKGYINDIHGVARLEFDFQKRFATSLTERIKFKLKANVSRMLDDKVFNNAEGIIFASVAMQNYFYELYSGLKSKNNVIVPYYLSSFNSTNFDELLASNIRKIHSIGHDEKVFLFAGGFKKTGGVPDLISAFYILTQKNWNIRLLMIGDGPTFKECELLIKKYRLQDRAILLGRRPYNDLVTFQSIADVLVCPDRMNVYSQLIIHVKYLDALSSGKLVINGAFQSVKEINLNEELSLMFEPSDINDLARVMEKSIMEFASLTEKYINTKEFTLKNLTYKHVVGEIVNQ